MRWWVGAGLIAGLSVLSTTPERRAAARKRFKPWGRLLGALTIAFVIFILIYPGGRE